MGNYPSLLDGPRSIVDSRSGGGRMGASSATLLWMTEHGMHLIHSPCLQPTPRKRASVQRCRWRVCLYAFPAPWQALPRPSPPPA